MESHDDMNSQLIDLNREEEAIMRELRELDAKAKADEESKRRRDENVKDDPEAALASLLLECEKEVRDAKGYIADEGPPLKIVRVKVGETAPKGATYLSRPRGTGVDFTVPVTLKAYNELIKRPIFLNQIRDKIKARRYSSAEDYLDDMRLLARNTATFNKGADLSWVVQHARFLLEAAEDAVTSRRRFFYDAEEALSRQTSATKHKSAHVGAASATGKRKRSSAGALDTNGDVKLPVLGSVIEVYWPNYKRWFIATILERSGSNAHVVYEEDNTDQWINLDQGVKWRMRNARAAAAGSAKGKRGYDPPTTKRRKGTSGTTHAETPSTITGGVSAEDLDAFKIEMFSKLDDFRDGVMEHIKSHLDTIDRILLRSDILQRVLLAVQDSQESLESRMNGVIEKYHSLEEKVEQFGRDVRDAMHTKTRAIPTSEVVEKENDIQTKKQEGTRKQVEKVAVDSKIIEYQKSTEVIDLDGPSTDKDKEAGTSDKDDLPEAEKGSPVNDEPEPVVPVEDTTSKTEKEAAKEQGQEPTSNEDEADEKENEADKNKKSSGKKETSEEEIQKAETGDATNDKEAPSETMEISPEKAGGTEEKEKQISSQSDDEPDSVAEPTREDEKDTAEPEKMATSAETNAEEAEKTCASGQTAETEKEDVEMKDLSESQKTTDKDMGATEKDEKGGDNVETIKDKSDEKENTVEEGDDSQSKPAEKELTNSENAVKASGDEKDSGEGKGGGDMEEKKREEGVKKAGDDEEESSEESEESEDSDDSDSDNGSGKEEEGNTKDEKRDGDDEKKKDAEKAEEPKQIAFVEAKESAEAGEKAEGDESKPSGESQEKKASKDDNMDISDEEGANRNDDEKKTGNGTEKTSDQTER